MLRPGALVGSLRIDGVIGRGAMGEVFRATQINLKRPVAVKRIAEHLVATPEALARFEREAQTLARVQSPWVVGVYDFARMRDDQGQEHYLLVMELVEGGRSLRSYIDTPLPWPVATSLALQVARGLAAAGALGVVHRDVKPHNIIVNEHGVAKLADFGLARSADSTDLTTQGMVLGTPAYMAPEACRGQSVDTRADLYSLGVTWYQLISSRTPFLAENTPAMLRAHVDDTPPRLDQSLVPGVPTKLADLVHRLLAKDPRDRPAHAGILVELILGLRASGLDFPDTVILPPTSGLVADQTTAATHVAAGMARNTATLTAALIGSGTPASAVGVDREAPTTIATNPVTAGSTSATAAPPPPPATSSGPALAPLPGHAPAARRLVPIVAALTTLAVAAGALTYLSVRPTPERALAAIGAARESGNLVLALQKADEALSRFPVDQRLIEAGTGVVAEDVDHLLAHDGPAAARALLSRRLAGRDWLDPTAIAIRIDCDEATRAAAAAQGRDELKLKELAVAPLAKSHPNDEAALACIVHVLHEQDSDLALNAAVKLAEMEDEPSAEVHAELIYAQTFWGASYGAMERVRTQLLRHWPDAIALGRSQLESTDTGRREAGYLLLRQARALTDSMIVRYEFRNLLELGSNSTDYQSALLDLERRAAADDWPAVRAAAQLPELTTVGALDEGPPTNWPRLRSLLERAFAEAVGARVPAWLKDTEHRSLRWNAWKIAGELRLPAAQDPFSFHAASLTTFDVESPEEDFDEAYAFFAAQATSPQAARAAQVVAAADQRVADELKVYRANPNLVLHVRFVERTLAKMSDLAAKFAELPR